MYSDCLLFYLLGHILPYQEVLAPIRQFWLLTFERNQELSDIVFIYYELRNEKPSLVETKYFRPRPLFERLGIGLVEVTSDDEEEIETAPEPYAGPDPIFDVGRSYDYMDPLERRCFAHGVDSKRMVQLIYGTIEFWDTRNITNMAGLFRQMKCFNEPIGNWDVDMVLDMTSMFENARMFNQPLRSWDVENVSKMSSMFKGAWAFKQSIGNWKFSSEVQRDVFSNYLKCGRNCIQNVTVS